jgi:outer membrane murein-binding lipoprotein Lpp
MRRIPYYLIFAAAVAALAALLLAGCQNRSNKENSQTISKEKEIHVPAPIDTSQMDEEFYRRMREFPESPSDR